MLGMTFLLGRGRDEAMLGHSAVDSLRDSTFPNQLMSTGAFRWIPERGCGVQERQGLAGKDPKGAQCQRQSLI